MIPRVGLDLLRDMEIAHVRRHQERLPIQLRVKRLPSPHRSRAAHQAVSPATLAAMDEEYDAICQGTLFTGDSVGIEDFLVLARNDQGEEARDDAGRVMLDMVYSSADRPQVGQGARAKKHCVGLARWMVTRSWLLLRHASPTDQIH